MKTNRRAFALASALAMALLAASPAGAQAGSRLVRVGFGGGVSVPTANAADALENGINGQAYLLVDPGFGFPLRFNLGYQKFDFKEALLGAATGQSTILSGVGGVSFSPVQIGPIRPYVTAGLGIFNVSSELDGQSESSSDTRFGIDGGAGLSFTIGRLEAFVEGRVQNVYTEEGLIESETIRSIPVTFGILF